MKTVSFTTAYGRNSAEPVEVLWRDTQVAWFEMTPCSSGVWHCQDQRSYFSIRLQGVLGH